METFLEKIEVVFLSGFAGIKYQKRLYQIV